MDKRDYKIAVNLILLVLFVIFLVYITALYTPEIKHIIQNPGEFERLLNSYGSVSILVFIVFQIVQVIIAAIPGELVQVAGGYVYGILPGTLYSAAGILLGSIGAFFLARVFGYRLVRNLIPKGSMERFEFLLNSKKADIALFILFLIPGLPKDVLTYMAGFTPINPNKFFLLSLTARLPGIFISALIGANMREKQYAGVVAVCGLVLVFSILGVLLKDKVIGHLKNE